MKKYIAILIAVLTINAYPSQNNKIEIGGFGFLSNLQEVGGFIVVRPIFNYYLNSWFYLSPIYNYKYAHSLSFQGNKSSSNSYVGLGFGINLKPFNHLAISLSSGALSQYYNSKSEKGDTISTNVFALSLGANLKYYLRDNLTLGLLYYLTADIANGSQYPDGGILIGFTYFIY